ncbi:MAG: RNA polymerase sigma factor [Acidobacteriota bacterium]
MAHPSTRDLLVRARGGDAVALEQLVARYRAPLQRWAHGRLPQWARDLADTEDLLQEVLTQTIRRLPHVEFTDEDALYAYLRQAVLNRIRNELRRATRHPRRIALDPDTHDLARSPLEAAIGSEQLRRYEDALSKLSVSDREAIIGRLELGLSFQELADAMGKPSAEAARIAVTRALVRLTTVLQSTSRPLN